MKQALSLLRVGVDLDGVLNNLGDVVLSELKLRGHCPPEFTPDDHKEYDYEKNIPGLDVKDVYKLFDEGDVFARAEPNVEARRVLDSLTRYGVQIHIVTSRDFSQRHRQLTEDWLRRHRFAYDRLAIYGKQDKSIYAEAHRLDVFIEDHLPTAELMSDVVRLSIILDQPYNRVKAERTSCGSVAGEYHNLIRMYSWEEIRGFFLGY